MAISNIEGVRLDRAADCEERSRSANHLDEAAASAAQVEAADIALAETLGRHRTNAAVRAVGALSEIADQAPAFTLCGVVLGFGLISGRARLAEAGGRMLASVLVATALKSALKKTVSRTRPHVLLDEGDYELDVFGPDGGDRHSFPSGHTADAVAAARALARVFPDAGAPGYGAAAVIAAVQIPSAKHYPLDVAAGALVGVASEAIVNGAAALLGGNTAKASRRGRGEESEDQPKEAMISR